MFPQYTIRALFHTWLEAQEPKLQLDTVFTTTGKETTFQRLRM